MANRCVLRPSTKAALHFDTAVFLLLGIGLLLRLAFLKEYFNLDWELDGYLHVVISKSVFAELPDSLGMAIVVWAKPIYTMFFAILYQALPSWPALVVTQVANSVMWVATGAIVLVIARFHFHNRNTLVILAALAAFAYVSFRASVTANTEPLGALIFALGLWLYQRRKTTASMIVLGSEILIRTDAIFCVVVFPLWVMAREAVNHEHDPVDWARQIFRHGAAFAVPLVIWNLLGFWRTGSPLFVITYGYPMTAGIYGFGNLIYYAKEFIAFDTLIFLFFILGSALVLIRRTPELLLVSTVAALLYFLAMTIIWSRGAFGSAGLLRYFVFQYPAWLLVAGVPIEAGLAWLKRRPLSRRWTAPIVAILCLATVVQLHWLVREPRWRNNGLTRVPVNQARNLPEIDVPWSTFALYTDRPDVLYYLGHNQLYGDRHPLNAVREPGRPGIFVFTEGFSEQRSGLTAKDFATLQEKAVVPDAWGGVFHVYVRP